MSNNRRHSRPQSVSSGWHVPESSKGVVFLSSLALCAVVARFPTSPASAVNVTTSATIAGQTPEIVGYNSGHFMPNSNTADWWRFSGVNGARFSSTPTVVEASDDLAPWGDGDRNGIVDGGDYLIWRHNLGHTLPGSAAGAGAELVSIPEPATVVLMCLGLLALCGRSRCYSRA